jgi:hypothetical protein
MLCDREECPCFGTEYCKCSDPNECNLAQTFHGVPWGKVKFFKRLWGQRISEGWEKLYIQTWLPFAVVLIIATFAVLAISIKTWGIQGYKDHFSDILYNVNGSLFDILALGFFVALLTAAQEKKRNIKRWLEEIDDYRGWNEPEAMYRIMGSVRRLKKAKVKKIDLSFCFLKHADLKDTDCRGMVFYSSNLSNAEFNYARFEGVELSKANLTDAILLKADFSGANFRNCIMTGADFTLAIFNGANFEGAILNEVYMNNAVFSDISQLFNAKTLWKIHIGKETLLEIKSRCL